MSNEPNEDNLKDALTEFHRVVNVVRMTKKEITFRPERVIELDDAIQSLLAAHRADDASELVDLLTEINRIYVEDDSNQFRGYEWLFNQIAPALAAHAAAKS